MGSWEVVNVDDVEGASSEKGKVGTGISCKACIKVGTGIPCKACIGGWEKSE